MNSSKTTREPHRYLIGWNENDSQLVYINDLTLSEQRRLLQLLADDGTTTTTQAVIVFMMTKIRQIPYAELYLVDSSLTAEEIETRFDLDFESTASSIRFNGEQLYSYKETEEC